MTYLPPSCRGVNTVGINPSEVREWIGVMKNWSQRWKSWGCVFGAGLLVTACGAGADASESTGSEGSEPSSTSATNEATSESDTTESESATTGDVDTGEAETGEAESDESESASGEESGEASGEESGEGGEAECGNGIVEEGEECDDGNLRSEDGCDGTCAIEVVPEMVAGEHHTCALTEAGSVHCWGRANFGQTGYGNDDNLGGPGDDVLWGEGAQDIAAGNGHVCALLKSGDVTCWGRNEFGQLGYGDQMHRSLPGPNVALDGKAQAIEAGYWHTCAHMLDGAVRCWGRNESGALGYGDDNGNWLSPGEAVVVGAEVQRLRAGGRSVQTPL